MTVALTQQNLWGFKKVFGFHYFSFLWLKLSLAKQRVSIPQMQLDREEIWNASRMEEICARMHSGDFK